MKAQRDFGRLGIHTFRNPSKLGLGWPQAQLWSHTLPFLWIPLNFICVSFVTLCSVLLYSGLWRSNSLADFISLGVGPGFTCLQGTAWQNASSGVGDQPSVRIVSVLSTENPTQAFTKNKQQTNKHNPKQRKVLIHRGINSLHYDLIQRL